MILLSNHFLSKPVQITNTFSFSGGERHVNISKLISNRGEVVDMLVDFKNSDDLIDMLLVDDALTRTNIRIKQLVIPYMPYARQDRHMNKGEAFSLSLIAKFIKQVKPEILVTADLHSNVLTNLLDETNIKVKNYSQLDLLSNIEINKTILSNKFARDKYKNKACLISPDAGASKKTAEVGNAFNLPVIQALKSRNTTNGNLDTVLLSESIPEHFEDVFILDDICDGGATFLNLGRAIRDDGYKGRLHLIVTHGIFSKGKSVFDDLFTTVASIFPHKSFRDSNELFNPHCHDMYISRVLQLTYNMDN